MIATVRLPAALRGALVEHARAEAPIEACGLVAGTAPAIDGGTPTGWHPAPNRLASERRFEIDPGAVWRLLVDFEARDEVVWAIVHSHVRSAAVPSASDIAGAAWWPDVLHVLVSLDEAASDPASGAPTVRAWRIADGAAVEVRLDTE